MEKLRSVFWRSSVFTCPVVRRFAPLATLVFQLSCQSAAPVFEDVFDGGDTDAGTDSDTGTETEVDTEAVEECEADIAIWYEQGCALTCDPNGVPVDCEWSTTSEAPLSVEQSQAFCELWASPACLEHLEVMLDCWAANFDAGALCPAPCLLDDGMPVLEVLELCLDDDGEG